MKYILLLFAALAMTSYGHHLNAQCTASNLNIVIKSVNSSGSGCQVTMDVSFTGDFNSGNKYAFIHLWESAPVSNYPALTYTAPPTAAQLGNALATLVIQDPGKSNASLYNQYPANTSVPVTFAGVGFSRTGNTYTFTNVSVNVSTCNQPVTVKGDIWASQASDGQVTHCFSNGTITLLLNNPVVTGFKQCVSPRLLNLNFINGHATLNESVVADVFIDMNSDGQVSAGDINITNSLSPALPNPINLVANSNQAFAGMSYLPYSGQAMYDNKPIIVRVNATAPGAASVTITKSNINFLGTCSLLPVTFKSFTATRNRATVSLKWETSSEQNSSSFAVERNNNGAWQQVATIPSQAAGGNSNSILAYNYDDVNAVKGLTQYRIRQLDRDGQSKYSETRAVRGEGQTGNIIVYPNPTSNGQVNVIFEDANTVRDISLIDLSGKVLKQWNGVKNNNMQVDILTPGIYSLKVIVRETGEQSVNKIIVTNR